LNIKQIYNPQTKRLNLTVSQTQTADKLTPAAFTLPLEIEITTANGTVSQKIQIKKREETFSIKVNDKPTNIIVDKDEKIPLKAVKI
jgi:hypothetical protein